MNSNLEMLKQQMEAIVKNEYEPIYDSKPFSLALKMLDIIGISDSYIRDDLVYMVMGNWIWDGVFSTEELRKIFEILQDDNHMFYKIGETDTDSVLTRSFSVLLIPLILGKHIEASFLNRNEIKQGYKNITRYYQEEKDLRGYIDVKGWAHSAAHTADAISSLVQLPEIGYEELKKMMKLIQSKVSISSYQYIHQEDERIVVAILEILKRKIIPIEEIMDYVKSFKELEKTNVYPDDMHLVCNVKHFLRSWYFRILPHGEYKNLADCICDVLYQITPFHD